jgi:hypothetical protein
MFICLISRYLIYENKSSNLLSMLVMKKRYVIRWKRPASLQSVCPSCYCVTAYLILFVILTS